MHPKADEFLLDVRRAMRMEARPTVTTDNQLLDPGSVARVLERAMIWFTPKVVEGYDPTAFTAWSEDIQAELREAVEEFRAVAGQVPSDKPATARQAQEGIQAFARLKQAVRALALAEWLRAGADLIHCVEEWAKELGWERRRQQKKLNELLLGEYALDQLYLYAEGHLYVLDPVARFIPGGLGTFDLSIQPSFYATSIYRNIDGVWHIRLDLGQGERSIRREPLNKDTLKLAIEELRSLL